MFREFSVEEFRAEGLGHLEVQGIDRVQGLWTFRELIGFRV